MTETTYTTAQLLHAGQLAQYPKDVLRAVLAPDGSYTMAQAKRLIQTYLKGKVK